MTDLNRSDLIHQMVARVDGLNHGMAGACLEAILDCIRESLAQQRSVNIRSFGKFIVRSRTARRGTHPLTHAPITISALQVPCFIPSPALKKYLNQEVL